MSRCKRCLKRLTWSTHRLCFACRAAPAACSSTTQAAAVAAQPSAVAGEVTAAAAFVGLAAGSPSQQATGPVTRRQTGSLPVKKVTAGSQTSTDLAGFVPVQLPIANTPGSTAMGALAAVRASAAGSDVDARRPLPFSAGPAVHTPQKHVRRDNAGESETITGSVVVEGAKLASLLQYCRPPTCRCIPDARGSLPGLRFARGSHHSHETLIHVR